MISVAVILGTYNGELYVSQQIDSILNQEDVLVHVFARDDGSKDKTVEILKKYASTYDHFHLMNDGETQNVGIKTSFMETLKWALSYSDSYDYFAFSDQDDMWLPNKLISGINKIKDNTNDSGAMYYSNKTIVDENLTIKKHELFDEREDFSNFFFVSRAYGCTIVMNRVLATLCCAFVSSYAHYHDDWVHRLAICLESGICFDTNSYILYRQHGDNNCGTWATDDKPFLYMMKRVLSFFKNNDGYNRSGFALDILEHYNDRLSNGVKEKLRLVAHYKESFRNKKKLLSVSLGKGRNLRDILIWKIKVLLGYF